MSVSLAAVAGTIDRRSKRARQGEREDPYEPTTFVPGEWDGIALAVARAGKARGARART